MFPKHKPIAGFVPLTGFVAQGRFAPRGDRPSAADRGTALTTTMGVVADALRLGPYLFGETFTAADVVIGSTLRWGMLFELIPDREEFKSYVARLGERPALKRSQATDAELAPPPAS